MLTTRDIEVIEFVKAFKAAGTDTICKLYYPSLAVAQRRLKAITEAGELKRMRDHISTEYIYYDKKPRQLKHALTATAFYRELCSRSQVLSFKLEPTLGSIRPDALFAYRYQGKGYLGVLEVELSNKGFDYNKYLRFAKDEFQNFFPVVPIIYVVGNTISVSGSKLDMVSIKADLSDFRLWGD